MSTQIYINPNACKPEYTKIAAHSFGFSPTNASILDLQSLYIGGGAPGLAWSPSNYDYATSGQYIKSNEQGLGVVSPINLVSDDVVTLGGTAYFNNLQAWLDNGWEINLIYGVFYYNCEAITPEGAPVYTFIPVETTKFNGNGIACFSTDVTLGSNYDKHDTRFLLGFNIYASCIGDCSEPLTEENLITVSYTFDIDRPCAVITSESNFIIRNCCEPIITELVNIPGLQVGSFHADDEGNCWEVISASQDVTNFTRNFVDLYASCAECEAVNPCPANLAISSCCVEGIEYVTGSLPGLNVGDTFVDNNGLCWYVSMETPAPISEESITVDTIISGGCEACTLANPCPDFWIVESCCNSVMETIATTVSLNQGDSFVDTNGMCWYVSQVATSLPTNYGIIVDTVYTGAVEPETNCDLCIAANPCPTEYFLTIRMCCDNDRIEVTSVPAVNMSFSEGSIFSDGYSLCWEVMSYSTTGVETYPINWTSVFIGKFPDCRSCLGSKSKPLCRSLYQVRNCDTDVISTAYAINFLATVGNYYYGIVTDGPYSTGCYEVLGYGYPDENPLDITIQRSPFEFTTCEECTLQSNVLKVVEVQSCCTGASFIIETQLAFQYGTSGTYAISLSGSGTDVACYTLVGLSTAMPSYFGSTSYGTYSNTCDIQCTSKYPCD